MRRPPSPRLRVGLTDRTDAYLVRLARDGDSRAYEAIVARYREPLRRACARIVPERSEDAVQQALLSAWMALERGADVRELRPWLYSIARNAAIDQARGIRSELVELGPEVPGGEDPAHAEARRREVTEVLEAVAALPERQRQALVDTALHGRATDAVAVDLGLSGGALRQLVHRARTTVRAAVPSVAFPVPAWLAELLGEEGARRGAVLLGSGSGAAIIAKTTATVATVGAVFAGGLTVQHRVGASGQRTESTRSSATTVAGTGGRTAGSSGSPVATSGGPLLVRSGLLGAAASGKSATAAGAGDLRTGAAPAPIDASDRDEIERSGRAFDPAHVDGRSTRPALMNAGAASPGDGGHADRTRPHRGWEGRNGDARRDDHRGDASARSGEHRVRTGGSTRERTGGDRSDGGDDRRPSGPGTTEGDGGWPSHAETSGGGSPQHGDGGSTSEGSGRDATDTADVPSSDRPADSTLRDNSEVRPSPE